MKKYKIHFSLTNLFGDSQKEVTTLQNRVKAFMVMLTGSTWLATNADWAMIVGFIGVALDTALACLYFEEVKPAADNGPASCEKGGEYGC